MWYLYFGNYSVLLRIVYLVANGVSKYFDTPLATPKKHLW
jgi:hypothetical protein